VLYLAGGDFAFTDRPSSRDKKKNITEGKEADLATAFDRPSFLTQRYVLRRCGLVAVYLLQKFCRCVAAMKHAVQFNVCLFTVSRFGP
jgi:hypothetical protein